MPTLHFASEIRLEVSRKYFMLPVTYGLTWASDICRVCRNPKWRRLVMQLHLQFIIVVLISSPCSKKVPVKLVWERQDLDFFLLYWNRQLLSACAETASTASVLHVGVRTAIWDGGWESCNQTRCDPLASLPLGVTPARLLTYPGRLIEPDTSDFLCWLHVLECRLTLCLVIATYFK